MQLAGNYELSRNAAWNMFIQLQGTANGIVTVLVDGVAVDGGLTTNKQFKCGPVFTNQNSHLEVTVVGMTPLQPVSCNMQGILSENVNDFSALASPGYGGGSVQNDPSQLLSAEVGAPLIENVTKQIPHGNPNFIQWGSNGSSDVILTAIQPFNISGYQGLLIHVDPNTSSNFMWLQINWYDQFGNFITITNIDSICPLCNAVVAAQGAQCDITIFNVDAVNHGVNSFSVIPLVTIPAQPDKLLDNPGLVFSNPSVIDNHSIVDVTGSLVNAGTTVSFLATMVWPGKAALSIAGAGGGGLTTWDATLFCTSATGVATHIMRIQPATNVFPPIILFQLASGLLTVQIHNSGAGNITPFISVMATS
jgi:hypothetical protein